MNVPFHEDPYTNKALMPALVTVITVLIQYLTTRGLSLEQEGITALAGAITTLLVYFVSNHKRLFS